MQEYTRTKNKLTAKQMEDMIRSIWDKDYATPSKEVLLDEAAQEVGSEDEGGISSSGQK
jgi:hypothetical protein